MFAITDKHSSSSSTSSEEELVSVDVVPRYDAGDFKSLKITLSTITQPAYWELLASISAMSAQKQQLLFDLRQQLRLTLANPVISGTKDQQVISCTIVVEGLIILAANQKCMLL